MKRVNLGISHPELYKTVAELDKQVALAIQKHNIDEGFSHLLRLRASQINGCAFCIRLHTHDALKCGESIERITLLNAWEETHYFSEAEKSALRLVEEITLISNNQVSSKTYEAALEHYSKEQLAILEWLAVTINAWNRIAITSSYLVAP